MPEQLSPSPISDLDQKIVFATFQEHLRQAQHTFNVAITAAAASIVISVIGATLIFSGKISEGAATTATGLVSAASCTLIANQSSEKLDRLKEDLLKKKDLTS